MSNSPSPLTEHQENWWGRQPCRRCNPEGLPDNRPSVRPACPDCDGSGWTVWAALATEPWSEVLPGLWVGGHDYNGSRTGGQEVASEGPEALFDVVLSAYARPGFAPWEGVEHHEVLFADSSLADNDLVRLAQIAEVGANRLREGHSVLCRCQAGLNRASLLAAMIMIWLGYTGTDAVQLIRARRSPWAFCNEFFEDAIYNTTYNKICSLAWRNEDVDCTD